MTKRNIEPDEVGKLTQRIDFLEKRLSSYEDINKTLSTQVLGKWNVIGHTTKFLQYAAGIAIVVTSGLYWLVYDKLRDFEDKSKQNKLEIENLSELSSSLISVTADMQTMNLEYNRKQFERALERAKTSIEKVEKSSNELFKKNSNELKAALLSFMGVAYYQKYLDDKRNDYPNKNDLMKMISIGDTMIALNPMHWKGYQIRGFGKWEYHSLNGRVAKDEDYNAIKNDIEMSVQLGGQFNTNAINLIELAFANFRFEEAKSAIIIFEDNFGNKFQRYRDKNGQVAFLFYKHMTNYILSKNEKELVELDKGIIALRSTGVRNFDNTNLETWFTNAKNDKTLLQVIDINIVKYWHNRILNKL